MMMDTPCSLVLIRFWILVLLSLFVQSASAGFHPPRTLFPSAASIMTKTETKPDSALKSFLSGGVGGFLCVLVGHPLDLVKVRMQTGGTSQSVSTIIKNTFAKDGVKGLYRGVSAPLVAIAPIFAVNFWGYDMGKRFIRGLDKSYSGVGAYHYTIPQYYLAGALAAFPTTVIMGPTERLKCLMQVEANVVEKGGTARYSGLLDCAKQTFKEGGMRSIFRGTGVTLMREIPGGATYFGTYELVKRELMKAQNINPASGQLSPLSILLAGGIAGSANWAIAIPIDTVKSRYQSAPEGTYSGVVEVYKKLMREEGPSALFKGFAPAQLRAFPANGACFLGVEIGRKVFAFLD